MSERSVSFAVRAHSQAIIGRCVFFSAVAKKKTARARFHKQYRAQYFISLCLIYPTNDLPRSDRITVVIQATQPQSWRRHFSQFGNGGFYVYLVSNIAKLLGLLQYFVPFTVLPFITFFIALFGPGHEDPQGE